MNQTYDIPEDFAMRPYDVHDRAVYSMWNHFVSYCYLLNNPTQIESYCNELSGEFSYLKFESNSKDSQRGRYDHPSSPYNRFVDGVRRLPIFVDLASSKQSSKISSTNNQLKICENDVYQNSRLHFQIQEATVCSQNHYDQSKYYKMPQISLKPLSPLNSLNSRSYSTSANTISNQSISPASAMSLDNFPLFNEVESFPLHKHSNVFSQNQNSNSLKSLFSNDWNNLQNENLTLNLLGESMNFNEESPISLFEKKCKDPNDDNLFKSLMESLNLSS